MSNFPPLTTPQKEQVLTVLRMGCSRRTAIHFAGVTGGELDAEMQHDAEFARDVLQAEAVAELQHMGRIQSAAKDDRNWRASAWWIERQQHDAQQATSQHIAELIERLAQVIVTVLVDEQLQRALIERLLAAVDLAPSDSRPPTAADPIALPLLTEAPEA